MLLTSTSDILRIVTGSAVDIDVHVSWADITASAFTPGRTDTKITTATTTTIGGSPAASTQRQIKVAIVRNIHAGSSNLVTIQHYDGTNSITVYKRTLLAGEQVLYDGSKFITYNASGLEIEGSEASPISDGDYGDVTVSGTGTVMTIDPGAVTLAKMADMATASLLGRSTAGTGVPEVLSASTARTLLGLIIGTNVQAYNANLTTYAGITPSANVQSVLSAADYSAIRTLLGLVISTNVQAYNANLTTFAGIAPAANIQSILSAADYSAVRTLLGLVIGTNVQAYDADLTTWASLTPSANAQSLVTAANYSAMRTLLNLVIGTDVQAHDADLDTWATKTPPSGIAVGTTDTQTLTNKRISPRTGTTTSSATPTINTDNVDYYSLTAQTVDITSFTTNLSGTPTDGQKLWISITGTAARAITWGASFEASTISLPTTTVTTNRLDVGFIWNSVTSKWRCIGYI